MEPNDILNAPVIQAEGLGKMFRIGVRSGKESFLATTRRLLTGGADQRELWALRGVSFKLERGEALGVIGPNGAGKSTLLLLLSQILTPTEGRCRVSGKAHCFFRIGAALQPRLTVLENFSLCSALLGLDREEFRARLPSMVSFSGLGDYLYAKYAELSSGLAARLPFSAAVHTDLDIILVDEMLMVGDRAFQAKCLRTFHDFRAQGKTLVIVSHSLPLVEALCQRALYLNSGRPVFLGETGEAIRRFAEDLGSSGRAEQQAAGPDALRQSFGARLQVPKIVSAVSRRMAFELGAGPAEGAGDWADGIKDAKTRELIDSEVRRLAPELRRAARGAAPQQPPPPPREPLRDQIRKDVESELAKMRQELRTCLEEYGEKAARVPEAAPPIPLPPALEDPEKALPLWRETLGHEGPLELCASPQSAFGTVLRTLAGPAPGNGAKPGDEIILAPITWPWVTEGVLACGFTPVFADISPGTYNLDPDSVRRLLGPRTRAVVLSHNGNTCADLDALSALCAENNLRLINCGCLSGLGGLYAGRFVGAGADLGVLFPMNPHSRWGLAFAGGGGAGADLGALLPEGALPEGEVSFLPARAHGKPLATAARVAAQMKLNERQLRDTEGFSSYTGFFSAYADYFCLPRPPEKARLAGRFFVLLVKPGAPFGPQDLPGPKLLGEARRTAMGGYGWHAPPPGVAVRQDGGLLRVKELLERGAIYSILPEKQDRKVFFETFLRWMERWKKSA